MTVTTALVVNYIVIILRRYSFYRILKKTSRYRFCESNTSDIERPTKCLSDYPFTFFFPFYDYFIPRSELRKTWHVIFRIVNEYLVNN